MRRAKRKMVLELFASVQKAHVLLGKLEGAAGPEKQELCMLCQNSAMQIGNEIEYWEGKGTQAVSLLEAYCEEVYQYAQGNRPFSQLEQSLLRAEFIFREEIPADKWEVVFFPYNASMWDSLASVWKAADQDPECNAFVVPIPYFEKNPDGSFGRMHYEGGQFPPDVPVVHWEAYDVRSRFPDIIFIHNPYDEHNFVTSVHPDYYASVLRNFTGHLVYIPYYLYVNNAVGPDTLLTSAALYADYVIIQSEECCKKCIQIYDEFIEENGCKDILKTGKEKFLPLGSPILDAAGASQGGYPVPDRWKEIIRKKGPDAKIVLYNTHISDVMGPNAARFFRKIRQVLKVFQSQEQIVLLWRPHPLTWQTIQSMNPGALQDYQAIVDTYRREGWGIYDDTPQMYRAVAISDAYYGDWSSLVTLFQEAGKPVLMQNLDIIDN